MQKMGLARKGWFTWARSSSAQQATREEAEKRRDGAILEEEEEEGRSYSRVRVIPGTGKHHRHHHHHHHPRLFGSPLGPPQKAH